MFSCRQMVLGSGGDISLPALPTSGRRSCARKPQVVSSAEARSSAFLAETLSRAQPRSGRAGRYPDWLLDFGLCCCLENGHWEAEFTSGFQGYSLI